MSRSLKTTVQRGGSNINTDDENAKGGGNSHAQDLIASGAKGEPRVHDIIGLRLKEYFDEIAYQPVPDRFVILLKQLEAKIDAESRLASETEN